MDADKAPPQVKPSQASVILQAAKAARTYMHEIEGRSFVLMLPTWLDSRIAYLVAGARRDDPAFIHRMLREELKMALVGWSSVTVDDLLKDGDSTLAVFDPDLVPILLDGHNDWSDALQIELSRRIGERDGIFEAAQKN